MLKRSIIVAAMLTSGAVQAGTLDDVRARGMLHCGVNSGLAGFATKNGETGQWQGFDVGFCRAVAAAVLGDPNAVEFFETTTRSRFTSLLSGEIDILARNTTWNFSTDVDLQLDFAGINYYDGQGFIVPRALGISSAKELDGRRVCVQTDSSTAPNLDEYFQRNNMEYEPIAVDTTAEAQAMYLEGECEVYTTDASGLAAIRATFKAPGDHVLLPEIISKEPLGPVVRHNDDAWADAVRWVLYALISAEEHGVTSTNVDELRDGTDNPEIDRMLGNEGLFGEMLGLDPDWAARAIKAVGNYGELFEKNIGENTPIGLSRGLNAQWTDGGLLYSPPFR
ncbi:amino acid ABC transporter substrate-binding protein [Pseudoponticoccus marisrubri]|uniref:Amino acid ABC transporter substrate-binding protein n=1 Tax=Pseudoponticoccus marisrubri TaxID=1685382 RepID=A0A0W7WPI9_9RHOB|nr:amino acid ABC transporter substrate-binding protein [Pseudoponticoccus marisrubri]KUF12495.1 amino acid ABC transporter substrate-binding protein [Pseudoponticoccus marisrubri]